MFLRRIGCSSPCSCVRYFLNCKSLILRWHQALSRCPLPDNTVADDLPHGREIASTDRVPVITWGTQGSTVLGPEAATESPFVAPTNFQPARGQAEVPILISSSPEAVGASISFKAALRESRRRPFSSMERSLTCTMSPFFSTSSVLSAYDRACRDFRRRARVRPWTASGRYSGR